MAPEGRDAWIAMAAAMVAVFGFILPMTLVPAFYAAPLLAGGVVSRGVAGGAALAVFLVALAAVYTRRRNRIERSGPPRQ
jgi:uncharacterized membrane protein (DUF485 family)